MTKAKVPRWGAPHQHVIVDTKATEGATVGVNLRLPDGTLVTASMILNPTAAPEQPGAAYTYWRLIREVPPNLVKIAALTGSGFSYRDQDGDWRLRSIGRQVLGFSYGDASPSPIWVTPHALTQLYVRLVVDVAFNGAAPSIAVGTAADPEMLLRADQSVLTEEASFEIVLDVELEADEEILISITPDGSSAGSGRLVFDTIPLEGI